MRTFLKAVFWIWGAGGLLICGLNYQSLSGSVGVGTSTYMALGFLYWLGGMVLFGIGAALAEAKVQPASLTSSNKRPEGYLPYTSEDKAWAQVLADRAARGDGSKEKTTEGRALAQDQAPASTSRWRWDSDK